MGGNSSSGSNSDVTLIEISKSEGFSEGIERRGECSSPRESGCVEDVVQKIVADFSSNIKRVILIKEDHIAERTRTGTLLYPAYRESVILLYEMYTKYISNLQGIELDPAVEEFIRAYFK